MTSEFLMAFPDLNTIEGAEGHCLKMLGALLDHNTGSKKRDKLAFKQFKSLAVRLVLQFFQGQRR